jgi:hypothetical protein
MDSNVFRVLVDLLSCYLFLEMCMTKCADCVLLPVIVVKHPENDPLENVFSVFCMDKVTTMQFSRLGTTLSL